MPAPRPKTVAVDFDGVLHSYTTFQSKFDPGVVLDPPVNGAIQWLIQMIRDARFDVVIFSTRNKYPEGIKAMREWLEENGLPSEMIENLKFPIEKPPAFLTIDDRVWLFQGLFPSPEVVANFKPWNKA